MQAGDDQIGSVLLGGWGHSHLDPQLYEYDFWWETGLRAGVLYWRPKKDIDRMRANGEFFRPPEPGNNFERVNVPPLSRAFDGGFDFMPFLLYHHVIMDVASYNYIQSSPDRRGRVPRWTSNASAQILSDLKRYGVLILEDYGSVLSRPDISESLSRSLQDDIGDVTALDACKSSMALWKSYLASVAEIDQERSSHIFQTVIPRLEHAERAISERRAYQDPEIGRYLYECLGDVNSTLFLGHLHDLPIYDWESYLPFYRQKFTERNRQGGLDMASSALRQVLEIFVPRFTIHSADDIMAIRADRRFAATRAVMAQANIGVDTEQIVREAADGILQMTDAAERFDKIARWMSLPLDLIPIPGLGAAAEGLATAMKRRALRKRFAWQLFFLDARKRYDRDAVRSRLKNAGPE